MAMMPPGGGAPPPNAPGLGGPPPPQGPPMMPPPGGPMGPPPMGPAAMPPPPRPPSDGLGPGSPFGMLLSNLSVEMSDGWQMLDGCVRMLKLASLSPDFSKSPSIAAVITDSIETLSTLISHHQKGHAASSSTPLSGQPTSLNAPDDSEENDSSVHGSAGADTVPEA